MFRGGIPDVEYDRSVKKEKIFRYVLTHAFDFFAWHSK